jgi:CHAT domain-containing protein/tetratricopeptide (TPR) repeat protein
MDPAASQIEELRCQAVVCHERGDVSEAHCLIGRALDPSFNPCAAAEDRARALNTLGCFAFAEGRFAAAEAAFAEAIAVMPAAPACDPDARARGWRNVGIAQSAQGHSQEAIASLNHALVEPASASERQSAWFSLANAYEATGHFVQAAEIYDRLRSETEGALQAQVLGSLAILCERIGELPKAREAYRDAIEAAEAVTGERDTLAFVLTNAATFFMDVDALDEAERLLRRARAWMRRHRSARFDIHYMNARAELALAHHRTDRALRTYRRLARLAAGTHGPASSVVLTVRRSIAELLWASDRQAAVKELQAALGDCDADAADPEPVVSRAALAMMALDTGDAETAVTLARASLVAETRLGVPELRWRVLLLLARLCARAERHAGAILLGKLAVNGILQLSAGSAAAGGSRSAFLDHRRPAFRTLIEWLARAARLPEAERVHQACRAEELSDLVRGDTRFEDPRQPIPLTEWEQSLADAIETIGRAWRDAPLSYRAGDGAEGAPDYTGSLETWLDDVNREPPIPVGPSLYPEPLDEPAAPDEATLRYIQREGGVLLSVRTAHTTLQIDVAASRGELNELCFSFRNAITDRSAEVVSLGARLYELLIAPAIRVLDSVQLLRIMADGALRYLSFAAMHDGDRFLLERWTIAYVSAAPVRTRPRRSRETWRVGAFGITDLDHAGRELDAIGAVAPARLTLGDGFTRNALAASLSSGISVLHIASHFLFDPARAGRSGLVIGGGDTMMLDEFRAPELDLSAIELLVLSACDTGVAAFDGYGFDSLAGLFQLRGAQTVVATLWPVADADAAALASTFYRLAFAKPDIPLAEALREAQLRLLVGAGPLPGLRARGGFGLAGGGRPRHPYHWAAHVLFGETG